MTRTIDKTMLWNNPADSVCSVLNILLPQSISKGDLGFGTAQKWWRGGLLCLRPPPRAWLLLEKWLMLYSITLMWLYILYAVMEICVWVWTGRTCTEEMRRTAKGREALGLATSHPITHSLYFYRFWDGMKVKPHDQRKISRLLYSQFDFSWMLSCFAVLEDVSSASSAAAASAELLEGVCIKHPAMASRVFTALPRSPWACALCVAQLWTPRRDWKGQQKEHPVLLFQTCGYLPDFSFSATQQGIFTCLKWLSAQPWRAEGFTEHRAEQGWEVKQLH